MSEIFIRPLNGSFSAFADRTRAVAAELYPNNTALARAVDAGWKKVGL